MTVEALAQASGAKPFEPFSFVLADGTRVRVRSPECMSRSPGGRTLSVYDDDGIHRVVDLLLVSCLEFGGKRK